MFGEGDYHFTVGENGEYGTVEEDLWASSETLVWISKDGEKLATFERLKQTPHWLYGTSDTTKDFSNIIVKDGCNDKPLTILGYFPGSFSWSSLFTDGKWRGNGHYRILPLPAETNPATTANGDIQMKTALTRETNRKNGGGRNYELTIMSDTIEVPKGCVDEDPEYCFKAAARGLCTRNKMPRLGDRTSTCKGGSVKECCKLSCAQKLDPDTCSIKDVLQEAPVATLSMTGAYSGKSWNAKQDSWSVAVKQDAYPGTDPRSLIALAVMKTAGEESRKEDDDGETKKINESLGRQYNVVVWLFGSLGGGMACVGLFLAALACGALQSQGFRGGNNEEPVYPRRHLPV